MICYAIFAGAPIIIVGYLGVEIQKRIPRVYSFSDYVNRVYYKKLDHRIYLDSHFSNSVTDEPMLQVASYAH